jgi:hypothetical protein
MLQLTAVFIIIEQLNLLSLWPFKFFYVFLCAYVISINTPAELAIFRQKAAETEGSLA